MRTVFNKLSAHALLRAAVYIILGVLMILFPQTVSSILVYMLAAYIAILGIINIVNYIRCRDCPSIGFDLVSGILMVVLAVLMVIFSRPLIAILPVFLGVLIIISAAFSLLQAINYGRLMQSYSILLIILDLLVIVGGVIVILNPFESAILLLQIFGGITIVTGIGELIAFFTYRKVGKATE